MTIKAISDEFNDSYNKIYDKLKQKGQEKLKEVFKIFWEANPYVNVVCWSQYTPHFNDGDECVFSIGEVTISNLNDKSQFDRLNWGEYDGEDETIWTDLTDGLEDVMYVDKMLNELRHFLYSASMKEILKGLFGDHCRVYATREGFEVQEYDHE